MGGVSSCYPLRGKCIWTNLRCLRETLFVVSNHSAGLHTYMCLTRVRILLVTFVLLCIEVPALKVKL